MPTVSAPGFLTLKELAAIQDPSGNTGTIIDYMKLECPMIEDAHFIQGNLPNGHMVMQNVSKPKGTYTGYNQGTDVEKSQNRQITFPTGSLTGRVQIADKIKRNMANADALLTNEAEQTIRGMTETNQKTMIYGDVTVDAMSFNGFYNYYNKLSDPIYGKQIYDGGGTGLDNGSILFVGWGQNKIFGITPKDSKAGIQVLDQGKTQVPDDKGKLYTAWLKEFEWNLGLAIGNPTAFVRLANISKASLVADPIPLINKMIFANGLLRSDSGMKTVIYCGREMKTYLDVAAANKVNVNLTSDNAEGKPMTRFYGMPIKILDAMTFAEERVV